MSYDQRPVVHEHNDQTTLLKTGPMDQILKVSASSNVNVIPPNELWQYES